MEDADDLGHGDERSQSTPKMMDMTMVPTVLMAGLPQDLPNTKVKEKIALRADQMLLNKSLTQGRKGGLERGSLPGSRVLFFNLFKTENSHIVKGGEIGRPFVP